MVKKEEFRTVSMFDGEFNRKDSPSDKHGEPKGEIAKTPRLKAIDRRQMLLKPVEVDKLVEADHEVRAIWELVGCLDLSSYYEEIYAVEGVAGRSATDPQLLISIWIYSYSKGISSAREISRLCDFHPAYQWLTGMEKINYHTLSDFRVSHGEALKELFVEVLGVLSSEGLVTLERVMHDGTKIKANASSDTFRTEGRIREHLKVAREQVQIMENESESEVSPRVAKAKERAVREKKERLESALEELDKIREVKRGKKEKEGARASMSDPEARIMKFPGGGYAPGYNVQISTDAENGVIVGVDVTQSGSDYRELVPAVEKIEETMERPPDQMVVDGGYTSRENILEMEEKNVDLIGSLNEGKVQSATQMNRWGTAPEFHSDAFDFDEESNTYTCPAGKILRYDCKETRKGRTNYTYRADLKDCEICQYKKKCCPRSMTKGRSIVRGVDDPVVLDFKAKMETEEAKEIYRQRGPIAEFTNAWIKEKIGLRQFNVQGLIKVGIESLWACITYNIQQWIRLCWKLKKA